MAAYSKLPLAVQDYAVGIQSVNQARDNIESVHQAIRLEHSDAFGSRVVSNGRGAPPTVVPTGIRYFGHHDTPLIARVVVDVVASANGARPPQLRNSLPPVVTSFNKTATGVIEMGISHIGAFYGVASPLSSSTTPSTIHAEARYVTSNSSFVGLVVYQYLLNTGDFVLTDLSFSLAIYGY